MCECNVERNCVTMHRHDLRSMLAKAIVHMDEQLRSLKFAHKQCVKGQLDVYCICCQCHIKVRLQEGSDGWSFWFTCASTPGDVKNGLGHIDLPTLRTWVLFDQDVTAGWPTRSTPSWGIYRSKARRRASVALCRINLGSRPFQPFQIDNPAQDFYGPQNWAFRWVNVVLLSVSLWPL